MNELTINPLAPPVFAANQLRGGALGVGAITFFVVSAAGPLIAIAGGFPIAMLLGNGAGFPAAICLVVGVLLCFAAGYTAMARHVKNAGGFYAFASQGLGGTAGGAASAIALLSYNAMQIGIYGLFGAVMSGLGSELLHISLPWWVYVYGAMGVIAVLGYRQVDLSTKILGGLVVGEYLGILALDLTILKAGGASGVNFASFTPAAFLSGSPAIGLLFCFACFIGFEATTIYSEEARNPERTIPLATYFSVLLIGGFYAFSAWCLVVGAGSSQLLGVLQGLKDPTEFVFTLSSHFSGSGLTCALHILFVTSVFAGLLAFHNATARYFYAMGRDGLLPSALGSTHAELKSPHAGSVMQTILAALVILVFAVSGGDPVLTLFTWLTNLGTLGIIALMALTSVSVIAFFHRKPARDVSIWQAKVLPAISGVALTLIVILSVRNFGLLTGASTTLSILLPSLIPAAAIGGIVLALMLRRRSPKRFAKLGHNRA